MKAGVFSGAALADADELLARVRGQPSMLGADLAGEVSTDDAMSSNPKGRNGSRSPRSTSASRPTRRATSPGAVSAATCCRRQRRFDEIADLKPGRGVPVQRARATRPPPITWSR